MRAAGALVIWRSAPAAPTDTLLARSAREPAPSATLLAAVALACVPNALLFTPVAEL